MPGPRAGARRVRARGDPEAQFVGGVQQPRGDVGELNEPEAALAAFNRAFESDPESFALLNKEDKDTKKDGDAAEPDPFKVTKKDAQGRDYRMCPQCGYNMYQQDRTWTCENCGYSYIE